MEWALGGQLIPRPGSAVEWVYIAIDYGGDFVLVRCPLAPSGLRATSIRRRPDSHLVRLWCGRQIFATAILIGLVFVIYACVLMNLTACVEHALGTTATQQARPTRAAMQAGTA